VPQPTAPLCPLYLFNISASSSHYVAPSCGIISENIWEKSAMK